MGLSLNAYAGTLTVYSTPYTYHSSVVSYAQANQFVIGKYSKKGIKKAAKPVISRGSPPLPTAVHRFSVNSYSLNDMIKYLILKRVANMEGRAAVQHRPSPPHRKRVKKSNQKVLILTLHYPINVYTLTRRQKAILLSKLKPFKNKKIYVEGYTDCSGTKRYNDWLANKRAKTVVSFLRKLGYSAVELPSYGKYHTLKTAEESRRVEIYVEK